MLLTTSDLERRAPKEVCRSLLQQKTCGSNCELSCENGRLSSLKFLRPRLRYKGRISRNIGRALACVARVTYFPSRSLSNLLRESVGSLKVEFQSLNQDNSRTTLVAFLNQLPPCREVEQKHMTGRGKKRGDGVHLVTTWRHTCPGENLPKFSLDWMKISRVSI